VESYLSGTHLYNKLSYGDDFSNREVTVLSRYMTTVYVQFERYGPFRSMNHPGVCTSYSVLYIGYQVVMIAIYCKTCLFWDT